MKWFDTENRLIKIIKLLENTSELSIEEISKKLAVSTKTIQNDIKDINTDLKNSALIDTARSTARLYITDASAYKKQRNIIDSRNTHFDSPQIRLAFIVDMLMNSDSPYLIDELAYSMNISRSTLIKDINKLKTILKTYNLTIQGQTSLGISLIGQELDLRFFILDNNYHLIYTETFLPADITDQIKSSMLPLKLDRIVLKDFFRYLTLSINRIRQGHTITRLPDKYQALSQHYYYKFLQKTLDALEADLELVITANERLFLTIPFITMRTPYDISSLQKTIKVSTDVLLITKEIITAIKEKMEITLNEKNSDILDEFVYHNYFLTNRLRYGLPVRSQIDDTIKEKYTVAYHMALIAKDVIENRLSLKIPTGEIDYLTAYFQIFLTESDNILPPYKTALICGTGRAQAKLIIAQLRKIFEGGAIIDTIIYNELFHKNDLTGYDLLISTVKIDTPPQVPVIFINESINESFLRSSIERIRYAHHLNIPLLHGVKSIVFNLLSEDRITILDNNLSYMENVQVMTEKLTSSGLLEKDFWPRLKQREAKSSMVLDDYIAFPHAKHSGEEIIITLGLIPGKLNDSLWPELSIIFLVAIPDNPVDDTILVKIYDEIISLASHKKIIKDIAKMTNYHDILMYFIKECELFI